MLIGAHSTHSTSTNSIDSVDTTPVLAVRRHALKAGMGLTAMGALNLVACGGAAASEAAMEHIEARDKGLPTFFAQVARLTVRDPLAQFLGAAEQGIMHYSYADAVRLAGHSCPTVAGAWLMTVQGLRALYGSDMPVRGEIEVSMRDARDSGVTGVIATVAQLLTGAAPETGFQGIGAAKRFTRHNLLSFGGSIEGILGLRRKDSGTAVQVQLDAAVVPWSDEMKALMPKAIAGQASASELQRFGILWQERVRAMLIDNAENPRMVQVSSWSA